MPRVMSARVGRLTGVTLFFESTRTGTRQIWEMLADGSDARQLTKEGQNESPNWSPEVKSLRPRSDVF